MFIWVCGKKREGRIVCIVVLDYRVAKQRAVIGEEDVVRWMIRHIGQHSHNSNSSSWQRAATNILSLSSFFVLPPHSHSFHPSFFYGPPFLLRFYSFSFVCRADFARWPRMCQKALQGRRLYSKMQITVGLDWEHDGERSLGFCGQENGPCH